MIENMEINKIGIKDFSYQTRKKLTNCLINLGLNELIQYSLVNEKESIRYFYCKSQIFRVRKIHNVGLAC